MDIDVCDVLVLTVCEHLPGQVLIQCINTTFRQVFNTKWSQRRGVSVLTLIPKPWLAVWRKQNPHSAGLSARVVPGGATDRGKCAGEPVAAR